MTVLLVVAVIIIVLGINLFLNSKVDSDVENEITSYEECVAAGNPIMKSYPPQCKDPLTGRIFVQEISDEGGGFVRCLAEQRGAEVCATIYAPVCATVNVQCIKAPCEPIKETFGNSCEACSNDLVEGYVRGEC